jgi:hypothetical protein
MDLIKQAPTVNMRCSFAVALFFAAFVGSGYTLPIENKRNLSDVDLIPSKIRNVENDDGDLVGLKNRAVENEDGDLVGLKARNVENDDGDLVGL